MFLYKKKKTFAFLYHIDIKISFYISISMYVLDICMSSSIVSSVYAYKDIFL